jgi:RNA polymerase sigma factor (TIGR02999 family)
MTHVTRILSAIEQGDARAAEQFLPLIYDELRKSAAEKMAAEKPGQTLEATALVNEAHLRLVGNGAGPHFNGRGQFFAAAAQGMRKILADSARRKRRTKDGGGRHRVELDDEVRELPSALGALPALDEALTRLAADDTEAAGIVEFRSSTGLSVEEAARLDRHRRPHDAPVRDNDGRAGDQVTQKVRR